MILEYVEARRTKNQGKVKEKACKFSFVIEFESGIENVKDCMSLSSCIVSGFPPPGSALDNKRHMHKLHYQYAHVIGFAKIFLNATFYTLCLFIA